MKALRAFCTVQALIRHPDLQVYLILDEFIMGGELQETSKKVRLCNIEQSVRAMTVLTGRDTLAVPSG